jgi:hypothetical protein
MRGYLATRGRYERLSWRIVFCKLFCFFCSGYQIMSKMVTKFSCHLYIPSELTLYRASCLYIFIFEKFCFRTRV